MELVGSSKVMSVPATMIVEEAAEPMFLNNIVLVFPTALRQLPIKAVSEGNVVVANESGTFVAAVVQVITEALQTCAAVKAVLVAEMATIVPPVIKLSTVLLPWTLTMPEKVPVAKFAPREALIASVPLTAMPASKFSWILWTNPPKRDELIFTPAKEPKPAAKNTTIAIVMVLFILFLLIIISCPQRGG